MFGTDFATLLPLHLNSNLTTVLYDTGTFLSLLSGLHFSQNIVEDERYSEYLSMNIPNGLFPSPGTKEIILSRSPFPVTSGSCSSISVTPEGHLSTSHQPSFQYFSLS